MSTQPLSRPDSCDSTLPLRALCVSAVNLLLTRPLNLIPLPLQSPAVSRSVRLDPNTLLSAYAQGVFPMADRDGVVRFYTADPRGIIPLYPTDAFHVPSTLHAVVRQKRFEVRFNHDFAATMRGCMEKRTDGTWINAALIRAYTELHELGFAHSVEAWQDGELAGGLYGVSLGGAFFGESMFHRKTDASKVALVHLVERLRERGYELLDTQASTPHLRKFGCIDISAGEYMQKLESALVKECEFD
jgi:leucyl/phenylalanyl-tRNA---protein transferase